MGITQFDFFFQGTNKEFSNVLDRWLAETPEGNRYKHKSPGQHSFIKIQRGLGFLTAPIIFEFVINQEIESSIDISAFCYIRPFMFLGKQSISKNATFGGLPRRNGWKDFIKLLSFFGIEKYQIIKH